MHRCVSRFRNVLERFLPIEATVTNRMDLTEATSEPPAKKIRAEETSLIRGKKMALYLAYVGKGYSGMQKNDGVKSIEEDLLGALARIGAIRDEHRQHPDRMRFQRCSRTDKGVSAALNVVSLKMVMTVDKFKQLNEHLPDQIKAIGYLRTTRGFDAKIRCSSRAYEYVTPTFAFAPTYAKTRRDYRISDDVLTRVRSLLSRLTGTHKFHNFTARKAPGDDSVQRYIMEFSCGEPFVEAEMEFVALYVRGQSFLLHQIRKMIGLVMAIAQGYTSEEAIERAWKPERMDVPRAPALGLFLSRPFYNFYNDKYGNDGVHQPIEFESYEEEIKMFREKICNVIVATERRENCMMHWLSSLSSHNYEDKKEEKKEKEEEKKEVEEENEEKDADCQTQAVEKGGLLD